MKRLVPLFMIAMLFASCGSKIKIVSPTVEMQDGKMPLATAEPRFSWRYEADAGNQMLYIPYDGRSLKGRDRCWWKVYATVTYGNKGRKKKLESEVQYFEISLLSPDDWNAHWIGRDYDDDKVDGHTVVAARCLRKEFELKEISSVPGFISADWAPTASISTDRRWPETSC